MSRPVRLPLVRSLPSLWAVLPALCAALALLWVGLVYLFRGNPFGVLALEFSGILLPGAVLLLLGWVWLWREKSEWAEQARSVGLSQVRLRVTQANLSPFVKMPLFRFARVCCFCSASQERACFWTTGAVEGVDLELMHYRYTGQYLTPKGNFALRGGVQTIALVGGTALPDFHLAPEKTEWDGMSPGWDERLRVGRFEQLVAADVDEPTVIHAPDRETLLRLFTPERVQQLGDLRGWTIESRAGRLLVYPHLETIQAAHLPHFVHRVVDFVRVLNQPLAEAADRAVPPGFARKS